MTTTILCVDDDKMIHKLVSAALEADGYELLFAASGQEAFGILKHVVPNLILLDLVLPDMDGYQICKMLRSDSRTTNIPIIMLTGISDLDNRLKAFQAGVDDFLNKPFQFEELQARVKVQLRWATPGPSHVKISTPIYKIAIFSLRGGVGISTLAVNLAAGLSQLWTSPTLLADMSFLNGQSALMLNARPRNSWADIGRIKPEEIETETLKKIVLHHPIGVDLLAAPRDVAEAELINEKHVHRVLELAGGHYKYLIMDLPHDFSLTTLAALDAADRILLLTAPDLGSVYSASNALKVLRDIGYADEKIQLVLNWNFSTRGLTRKNIEDALQKRIAVIIPNMPDSLVVAITLGKPVVLDPDKKEAAVFEDLAYFWSTEEDKKNIPTAPNSVWLRVMERAKHRHDGSTKF